MTKPDEQRTISAKGADFLLEEYRGHEAAIYESERTGETRVNFYLTVTSAIFAALLFDDRGLMDSSSNGPRLGVCAVLLALLTFGRLTLARVVHRNLCTDREIESARKIRAYFVAGEPSIATHVSRSISLRKTRERMSLAKLVERGGLAETVMLWNALIVAILFALFGVTAAWRMNGRGSGSPLGWLPPVMATITAVAGLMAAWWVQQSWVNTRYLEAERARGERAATDSPEGVYQ